MAIQGDSSDTIMVSLLIMVKTLDKQLYSVLASIIVWSIHLWTILLSILYAQTTNKYTHLSSDRAGHLVVTQHGDQSVSYQHMTKSRHHHQSLYNREVFQMLHDMLDRKLSSLYGAVAVRYNVTFSTSLVTTRQSQSETINNQIVHRSKRKSSS